jgi:hypothetical protein
MAGTWTALANQPPFSASTMLLLTDGTVMVHDAGAAAGGTVNWRKLTPDQHGNYVNGSWTQLASGPNAPQFYASAVLRDGRVFVAGGEYNSGAQVDLLAAQIYDPLANSWTVLPTPAGWTHIGDASCSVLPDGRVLIGSITDNRCAIYDPTSNSWSPAASKANATTNEETWTLLPDGSVLTADCNGHPRAEKYVPAADRWFSAGSTPVDLVEASSIEIGPAVLLPDGRTLCIGATNATAIYTMPPIANQPGSWVAGPSFPVEAGQTLGAKDAPASLLPNGRVLCTAGPVDGKSGDYLAPTYFFEFDPNSLTMTPVPNPPNNGKAPFNGRMLLLPTGQVLYTNGSTDVEVYTPDGTYDPSWQPHITSCPAGLFENFTYTLHGRQLNGLSQAVSYGDDATMATNYPLVKLRNLATNQVAYCRTSNHSTMAVATGSVVHSTQFRVPGGLARGSYELTVVANGIPSQPITVSVTILKITKEIKEKEVKIEIKELKEKEHLETALTQPGSQQQAANAADWADVIRALAERTERLEQQLAGQQTPTPQPFIRAEERPSVGDGAIEAAARE